jgi:hypothetical protein
VAPPPPELERPDDQIGLRQQFLDRDRRRVARRQPSAEPCVQLGWPLEIPIENGHLGTESERDRSRV